MSRRERIGNIFEQSRTRRRSNMSKFGDRVSKLWELLLSFLLAALQFVGFLFLLLAFVSNPDKLDIASLIVGAILFALSIFLESKHLAYVYAKEYIALIVSSPVRVFTRVASFVIYFIALFKGDNHYFTATLSGSYWSEAFYAALFGMDKRSRSAQRKQDEYNRRARERREADARARAQRAEAEARQRALAAERERQRIAAMPNDADGHVFLNTVFGAKPLNAYNYSETRTYYGGKPVIKISFTLDYKRGQQQSSMDRARTYCKEHAQKNYDTYCARVRNSVPAPTIEFTITPGKDTAAY